MVQKKEGEGGKETKGKDTYVTQGEEAPTDKTTKHVEDSKTGAAGQKGGTIVGDGGTLSNRKKKPPTSRIGVK